MKMGVGLIAGIGTTQPSHASQVAANKFNITVTTLSALAILIGL